MIKILFAILILAACKGQNNISNETQYHMTQINESATAVIAGGCFWCVETIMQRVKGVYSAESGYTGGKIPNPTYKEVCSGLTGHAEAVRISFDSTVITYKEILEIFMATHDPTTLNRQGADVGTQYRSAIFYANETEKLMAQDLINELTELQIFEDPIVTTIEPLGDFFVAEDYHQNYYNLNSEQPYCKAVINPKLTKFRQKFAHKMKED